jgi:hypothetical protein
MEPENPLPSSEEAAAGTYAEPDASSPRLPTSFP